MNFTHYCKNLRSHENRAIILPAECNRPAWNYLKNNNARGMPPTFSYCYERNYYFFANFCKQCAILPEMAKETYWISLQAWAPNMLMLTAGSKVSWKKHYLPETQEGNDTHCPQQPMGFMSQSRDTPWHTISSTEICYSLISTSVSWQPRNASGVIN